MEGNECLGHSLTGNLAILRYYGKAYQVLYILEYKKVLVVNGKYSKEQNTSVIFRRVQKALRRHKKV